MKKLVLTVLFILIGYFILSPVYARHIVGGEIRMAEASPSGRYTITMIQFWDANTLTTNGNRDAEAELLFYRKRDNTLVYRATLPYISSRNITYQNQACAAFRSLKTIEGTYRTSVTLPATDFNDSGGYYIVWERCCRNDDINNIVTPGSNGMVFYLEFPSLTTPNSSPVFSFPNGDYICKGQQFSMNASATDADGDVLKYSLVTPMRGSTSRNRPNGDDTPKSGYPLVQWVPGISQLNMIPGSPALEINSQSGRLSVVADQLGLYVFTVQCEEYRNGKKIGIVRRDFQLLVIECSKNAPPPPVVTYGKLKRDLIEFCDERPVELETEYAPNWSYQWQLNGLNITGATAATYVAKDTGSYVVVKSFKDQCSIDTTSNAIKLVSGAVPTARISQIKEIVCDGDSALLSAFQSSTYGYQWKFNDKVLPDVTSIVSARKEGKYNLIVTDTTNGCTAEDSAAITIETVSVDLPAQASVLRGGTLPLTPKYNGSNGVTSFTWAPPIGLSNPSDSIPHATPGESTQYKLTVSSPAGCTAIDSIFITVFDRIYIPDAFSPNQDGVNDTFVIWNGKDQIEDIRIFNRWGEVVYYSNSYEVPWDGKFKGEIIPTGDYLYVIKTSYYTYRGNLHILR